MSETDLHTPVDDETVQAPAPDWPSPGQKLQKIREQLGLSHGRVADALHLTAHYVKALENDQYDKLPGKTFVKGYFRSYAKLLGVSEEEIMACYQHYVAAIEECVESEANEIRAKKAYDQNLRWMICAALIIVVVVGVSWWLAQQSDTDTAMAGSQAAPVINARPAGSETFVTAEALVAGLGETAAPDYVDLSEANTAGNEFGIADANASENAVAMTENLEALEGQGRQEEREELEKLEGLDGETAQGDNIVHMQTQDVAETVVNTSNTDTEVTESLVESSGDLPNYMIFESDSNRLVQLESEGEDMLVVHFTGASWIEVDNGDNTRLYNDMLGTGDDLSIRGKAPFSVLVGNAKVVAITFNSRVVDVSSNMRTDNSVRLTLEPETR